jgi:hypothetical protein
MSTDVEDLLREGMARVTADLRAPSGMVMRVVRRRRRTLALRSAATAAVTLGACAVILMTVVVPGTANRSAVDTAYVMKRVNAALSPAAGPDLIAQMTVTTSGNPFWLSTEEWSYGDQWRSVAYSKAGKLVLDDGVGPSSVYTLVNYPDREWARQHGAGSWYTPAPSSVPSGWTIPGSLPAGPFNRASASHPPASVVSACWQLGGLPMLFGPGLLLGTGFSASLPPATVIKELRTAVSCGSLVDSGRQLIDGIDAIKLTSGPGSFLPETIWVNPDTYLPIRVVVRLGSGTQTANIAWLQPTRQNLADLTVPIPAGFRQVPLSDAGNISIPQAG